MAEIGSFKLPQYCANESLLVLTVLKHLTIYHGARHLTSDQKPVGSNPTKIVFSISHCSWQILLTRINYIKNDKVTSFNTFYQLTIGCVKSR